MRIAIFGGTGFVGNYIVSELLNSGYKINVLVRPGSESKLEKIKDCNVILGKIDEDENIDKTLQDCSAVIYNIGIIREYKMQGITFEKLHFKGLKSVVDSSKKMCINRFILMSANGINPSGTGYQKSKYKAEVYLKTNIRDWTIIRPSLIFGDSKGKMEFCSQLKKDMLSLPFPAPSFFSGFNFLNVGKFKMSPIHVKDVASIFVKSVKNNHSFKKIYHIGGNDFTWNEIIKIILKSYGGNKMLIPAPALLVYIVALILDKYSWFPISSEQLTMLLEGNICDSNSIFTRYNIKPIEFKPDNLKYLI